MSDLFQRMVEEGARALAEDRGWDWRLCPEVTKSHLRGSARAALTAALALAERDGAVLTVVPDAQNPDGSTSERYAVGLGWNACRAALLAGKVTP